MGRRLQWSTSSKYKAKLSVRPTDTVRMVGEEDPVFTLNYTGFKLQDDVSVLDEEPTAYT